MKKKQVFLVTAAFAVTAVLAVGCGKKETAESLMKAVTENTQGKTSVEGNMLIDLNGNMAVEQNGIETGLDIILNMDMDLEAMYDEDDASAVAGHIKGTMSMEALGANIALDMESYTVPEDGKIAAYTGTQGQWTRIESEIGEASSLQKEMFGMGLDKFADQGGKLELADKTETIGGKECYKLTVGVNGDVLQDMMDMSSGAMGDSMSLDTLDFSDVSLDYVMYIDKKEKLPVKIMMDGASMMTSVLSSIQDDIVADVEQFDIVIDIEDYDTVSEITVPEDVKAQAVLVE